MAPTIIKTTIVPTPGWYSGGGLYDLVDLATVKAVLGITDGSTDANLQLFITQASAAFRRHCNRVFQIQTYQDLVWTRRDPYPWQLPSGLEQLQLQAWPIAGQPCLSGTAAPSAVGALSAVAGGALPAQNYVVRASYTTPTGESPAAPEINLVVAAGSLLQVAPPPADPAGLATGWNVYVGTAAGAEMKQNGAPLALSAAFTLGATGVQPGAAVPGFISVTLNANGPASTTGGAPQNLIEGRDFQADYEHGQLIRLSNIFYPKRWEMLPTQVVYQAGFAKDDPDLPRLQDLCIRMIRGAYFAAGRDPNLRSENIEGVWSAQYWFANGPGGAGFPPDIEAGLDEWRVPVVG